MLTRRQLLESSALIALSPSVPLFLRQTARATESARDQRILVVIQLSGGNDGFNTVIPYADELYVKHRPVLRQPEDRLHRIAEGIGLHPAMRDAADLFEQQRLSIVQGVGYPNPNRSHDVSMAIWHTARLDREDHRGHGWLGRALDARSDLQRRTPSSMLIGTESTPVALRGRRNESATLASINEFFASGRHAALREVDIDATDALSFLRQSMSSAYATAEVLKELSGQSAPSLVSWPSTQLASRLQLTAQLIKAELGTRVFYVVQDGYDTHKLQSQQHARLLRSLSQSLRAFLDDLADARLEDRVLVLCFSEFGRQLHENASGGTDHGTAGPVFLAGSAVSGGLVGQTPDLSKLNANAPDFTTDFRRVYATVLEKWLHVPAREMLGDRFEPLNMLS